MSGHFQIASACLKGARSRHSATRGTRRATLENTIRKTLREEILRSAGGRGAKLTRQAPRQEEEGELHPMLLYRVRQRR